jgi:HEAT repeat protein
MEKILDKEAFSVLKSLLNKEDKYLESAAITAFEEILKKTKKQAKDLIPELIKLLNDDENPNSFKALPLLATMGKSLRKKLFAHLEKIIQKDDLDSIFCALDGLELTQATTKDVNALPAIIRHLENIDPSSS